MALDDVQRVLDLHARWVQDWREELRRLEIGKLSVYGEGPTGRLVDLTTEAIAKLKAQIAAIEELDAQYRSQA